MMARPNGKQGRYTSRTNAVARQAAQMLLLKPALWRLLTVRVHGKEHLDSVETPYVIYGNHSSHFDGPLIFGALPRKLSQYLATGAAADYFFDKWWKALPTSLFFNAYPVERSGARTSRRGLSGSLLSEGVPVLIFPEGTRSRTGAMAPFKPGVAALCISRGVQAVPVALVGAYEAWPPTQRGLPKGRPEVHVVFGRPLRPSPGEIAHEFNERMRRQLIELHDSTARAYGRKTLAEYARNMAIERALKEEARQESATSDDEGES